MEKLLVTNNFSFSHSVFKRIVLQTCKNQGLFGKGLMHSNILNRKRNVTQIKYNPQFSLHLYNETVYICNDKILVQQ